MFTDPRFLASDLHYARRAVAVGRAHEPDADAPSSTRGSPARAPRSVNPLLSFTHSSANRRQLPSPERLLVRVPSLPRALPVGDRLRDAGTRPTTAASRPATARELVAAY